MYSFHLDRNSPCVECQDLTDPLDFLDQLRTSQPQWGDRYDCDWVFRGHLNHEWAVRPVAWRLDGQRILAPLRESFAKYVDDRWSEFDRRLRNEVGGTWPKDQTIQFLAHIAAEREAVRQFAVLSDQIGRHLPDDLSWVQTGREYLDELGSQPTVDPDEFLAFAQHHRVPTRLLDWTRSALVAAFFACWHSDPERSERIGVWAANVPMLRETCEHIHALTCRRWQHDFLHAQDGLFLWLDQHDHDLLIRGEWPSLVQAIERCSSAPSVRPYRLFTLPTSHANELLRLLWRERITIAHLMPTYEHVSEALIAKWESDPDPARLEGKRVDESGY